jgi:mannose-1-phosphate guanylyltransferase/mannose-6-phosphate isomerase
MEHAAHIVMVPLQSDWSDVGSWDAWARAHLSDKKGNTARGTVVMRETEDTFVQANHRLVATLGVQDLVIVETADAVLVMDRYCTDEMRDLMRALQKEAGEALVSPPRVHRPWGSYEGLATGPRYQVKRITVAVGGCLSLQMHHHRSEHWIVVRGSAKVTRGESVFLLTENQSTDIPMGTIHRLENVGKIPLEMIEVQLGSYLGEDDIVRMEDVYGRDAVVVTD